ncbi:hypothetical protein MJO28_016826, partial [Puccinia striiformis f. sp. tritici]
GSDWDRNTKQPDCLNAVKRHEIGCIQWALLSCLLLCRAISPIALVCFTLRYTLAAPFLDVSTAPIFQTIVPLANLPLQDLQPYKPYQVDLAPFSRQKKFSLKHQVGRTLTCKYQENKILAKNLWYGWSTFKRNRLLPLKLSFCRRMPGGSLRGLSERV